MMNKPLILNKKDSSGYTFLIKSNGTLSTEIINTFKNILLLSK